LVPIVTICKIGEALLIGKKCQKQQQIHHVLSVLLIILEAIIFRNLSLRLNLKFFFFDFKAKIKFTNPK
jgi:hypothetical protein